MQDTLVDINIHEDDSVQRKLSKKAIKLQKKYYKRRKIDEDIIRKKTPLQKAFSVVFDIFLIGIAFLCGVICFCNIASRIQNLPPSIAGYSIMEIASGSMVASGFNKGDSIVIKGVDTDTLKNGDMISFYVYKPSYEGKFSQYQSTELDPSTIGELKYKVSPAAFFGIRNEELKTAASTPGATPVFHLIVGVYEDDDGVRWFKTRGTSNAVDDPWWINENYVLGALDTSVTANVMAWIIDTMTSSIGSLFVLLIPLVIIAVLIIGLCLRDTHIAMLENDIVEEKRKLTDDICVKNKVGYQMSNKTKYKVLATAPDDEKLKYISLLWKRGDTLDGVRKYYLRKKVLIDTYEEKRDLNRQCEKLFEAGENPKDIAKFYEAESAKIDEKYERNRKLLKAIRSTREEEKKALEELKQKQVKNKKSRKEKSTELETVKRVELKEIIAGVDAENEVKKSNTNKRKTVNSKSTKTSVKSKSATTAKTKVVSDKTKTKKFTKTASSKAVSSKSNTKKK